MGKDSFWGLGALPLKNIDMYLVDSVCDNHLDHLRVHKQFLIIIMVIIMMVVIIYVFIDYYGGDDDDSNDYGKNDADSDDHNT